MRRGRKIGVYLGVDTESNGDKGVEDPFPQGEDDLFDVVRKTPASSSSSASSIATYPSCSSVTRNRFASASSSSTASSRKHDDVQDCVHKVVDSGIVSRDSFSFKNQTRVLRVKGRLKLQLIDARIDDDDCAREFVEVERQRQQGDVSPFGNDVNHHFSSRSSSRSRSKRVYNDNSLYPSNSPNRSSKSSSPATSMIEQTFDTLDSLLLGMGPECSVDDRISSCTDFIATMLSVLRMKNGRALSRKLNQHLRSLNWFSSSLFKQMEDGISHGNNVLIVMQSYLVYSIVIVDEGNIPHVSTIAIPILMEGMKLEVDFFLFDRTLDDNIFAISNIFSPFKELAWRYAKGICSLSCLTYLSARIPVSQSIMVSSGAPSFCSEWIIRLISRFPTFSASIDAVARNQLVWLMRFLEMLVLHSPRVQSLIVIQSPAFLSVCARICREECNLLMSRVKEAVDDNSSQSTCDLVFHCGGDKNCLVKQSKSVCIWHHALILESIVRCCMNIVNLSVDAVRTLSSSSTSTIANCETNENSFHDWWAVSLSFMFMTQAIDQWANLQSKTFVKKFRVRDCQKVIGSVCMHSIGFVVNVCEVNGTFFDAILSDMSFLSTHSDVKGFEFVVEFFTFCRSGCLEGSDSSPSVATQGDSGDSDNGINSLVSLDTNRVDMSQKALFVMLSGWSSLLLGITIAARIEASERFRNVVSDRSNKVSTENRSGGGRRLQEIVNSLLEFIGLQSALKPLSAEAIRSVSAVISSLNAMK